MNENKESTYELLMKSAYLSFSQNGYEKATIDEITQNAGLTKGAVYWHFKSKEDLFLNVIDYTVLTQQKVLNELLQIKHKTLNESIFSLLSSIVSEMEKNNWIQFYFNLISFSSNNEKVKEKIKQMHNQWRSLIQSIFNKWKKEGFIRGDVDLSEVTVLLIALFDGCNIQKFVGLEKDFLGIITRTLCRLLKPI